MEERRKTRAANNTTTDANLAAATTPHSSSSSDRIVFERTSMDIGTKPLTSDPFEVPEYQHPPPSLFSSPMSTHSEWQRHVEWTRSWPGSVLLLLGFCGVLVKCTIVVMITSFAVAGGLFSGKKWLAGAIGLASGSVILSSMHAHDLWLLLASPNAMDESITWTTFVYSISQIIFHIIYVVVGTVGWQSAFTNEAIQKYAGVLPSVLGPFILFDTILMILVTIRRRRGIKSWVSWLICPFKPLNKNSGVEGVEIAPSKNKSPKLVQVNPTKPVVISESAQLENITEPSTKKQNEKIEFQRPNFDAEP